MAGALLVPGHGGPGCFLVSTVVFSTPPRGPVRSRSGRAQPVDGALQGREDSNPRRVALETTVLAAELRPYGVVLAAPPSWATVDGRRKGFLKNA